MNEFEARRAHAAAKIIETDGVEGYYTCYGRHGPDVADALLVLFLRLKNNPSGQYPVPDGLVPQVNDTLRERGILRVEAGGRDDACTDPA